MNGPCGALMYHDILGLRESGCPGAAAAPYKVSQGLFATHLSALRTLAPAGPAVWRTQSEAGPFAPFMMTFDDGGASAVLVADLLAPLGWHAHFFVTTDWIGRPGFLNASEIRALHAAGHVIGTHSASHPSVLSTLPPERLASEWAGSAQRLADLLGQAVTTGSVPGGYLSAGVVRAARSAGLQLLWTSEPIRRVQRQQGLSLIGRFAVYHDTPPWEAAALAGQRRWRQRRQWLRWSLRKPIKQVLGSWYPVVRRRLLERGGW